MPFQAYNHMLIADKPIKNVRLGDTVIGYEFQMQYPSYRGTFLSCIEKITFQVDGQAIDKKDVVFQLNGKQFLVEELPECFKEYWFVLDFATVRIMKDGGLSEGEHEVRVYLKHRIPYTGYFGQYLVLEADENKRLTVK